MAFPENRDQREYRRFVPINEKVAVKTVMLDADGEPLILDTDASGNLLTNDVNKLAITNAIEETAYDLNAAAFSEVTSITNDFILDSLELNFSTAEAKTITITSSNGTILWGGSVDTSVDNSGYNTTAKNINLVFNQGFNGGDNITVAVTAFTSPGTMDCTLKVKQGTATLVGNPQVEIVGPVDSKGDVKTSAQPKTTPPLDALFSQSISEFTLAVDTGISGITTLVRTFTASASHGIIIGDEVLLLDVVGNWSFFAEVTNVVGNVITVDRPIDHVFPSATALGRRVTCQMAVDGSTTPQIFSLRAGEIPADTTRCILTMLSGSSMDDSKFGSLPRLANGLVFRIVNSFQKTIFCWKTNGDAAQFAFDTKYPEKVAQGKHAFNARVTFAGEAKHGTVLRIVEGDVLQWIVQDDLSDLESLKISAMGRDVTD